MAFGGGGKRGRREKMNGEKWMKCIKMFRWTCIAAKAYK